MTTITILGLGSIGMRHAGNFIGCGADVVGFDPDPKRRAAFEEQAGRTADNREDALSDADAAVIASPNRHHLEDLIAAANADCHVLAEKPLAHTTTGLDAVLESFRSKGLTLFAGLNLRFHPAIKAARKAFDEQRLGTILWARFQMSDYLPNWRSDQDYRLGYTADAATGGVLFDMVHEFDLANHLLGPGRTVSSVARNSGLLEIDSEDTAEVVLSHEGGWHSSLHLDYITRPRRRVAKIAGTEGLLTLNLDERRMVISDPDGQCVEDKTFPGSYDDDYVDEARAFLDCIDAKAAPQCDGAEALDVLAQVIEARRLCGLPEA